MTKFPFLDLDGHLIKGGKIWKSYDALQKKYNSVGFTKPKTVDRNYSQLLIPESEEWEELWGWGGTSPTPLNTVPL